MPFSLRDKGTPGAEQKGWDEGMLVSDFARLYGAAEKRGLQREFADGEFSRLADGNSYGLRLTGLNRLCP